MTTNESPTDTQHVYDAAKSLWTEAQEGVSQADAPPEGYGLAVKGVPDDDIAERSGLELEQVREHLRALDGTKLVVRYDDQPALSVTAVFPE